MTTETLELILNKLPPKARRAFRVPDTERNLISCAELIDAGCGVYLHKHGRDIVYEGEVLYKGWRDTINRLWQVSLAPDATNRITPPADPKECEVSNGMVLGADAQIKWSVNSIYECARTKQLIKCYHASLGSHPKRTLVAAVKRGYLKGFKGLSAERVNVHIGVEYTTEAGHMRALPKGVRSTTFKTKRSRSKKSQLYKKREAAATEVAELPDQVPGNKKTHLVFMTTVLADNWIASNQMGAFPWTSKKGKKYICVFYIFDPNFIKGVPIKSRHKEELLRAYQKLYKWYDARGVKPQLHKMDNDTSKEVEDFMIG